MTKIQYNVSIPLKLWKEIKSALDSASGCDHDEVRGVLRKINTMEGREVSDDETEEDEEEALLERSAARTARRRANARPIDGEDFYDPDKGTRHKIRVIPNPPGMKGLDKYRISNEDGRFTKKSKRIFNRLYWSQIWHAWVEKKVGKK